MSFVLKEEAADQAVRCQESGLTVPLPLVSLNTGHAVTASPSPHLKPNYLNCSLGMNGSAINGSEEVSLVLPREMTFTEESLMSVVVYSILFSIAALGNLTVFITLFRNRHRRSRVNLFIMHLAIADLVVTLVMMPLEIVWHLTVSWNAGDAACRILMFFRAFGFYLSSFILVAISLDRYFAIAHPLSLTDADRRGKLMLLMAWLFSFTASIPQSVIFHVEYHPQHTWFPQCVTFNFFPTPRHELAYNLFNIMAVYVVPLVVIIVSYSKILFVISTKTRESREQAFCDGDSSLRRKATGLDLRRSGLGRIEKARSRTLKMTIVIVFVFIVCWTPYFVMAAWWWFKQESADRIHPKVQKGLFLFAVSNSCMNPIVYGLFAVKFAREFRRCCVCFKPVKKEPWQNRTRTTMLPSTASTMARYRGTICEASLRKHAECGGIGTVTPLQSRPTSAPPASGDGCSQACAGASTSLRTPEGSTEPLIMAECSKTKVSRTMTPPHIAQGKGTKATFDKYRII